MVVLAVNLSWGLNFLAIKYAVDEMPPVFAAGLRFALIFILLLPFLRLPKGNIKPLLTAAFVIGALHFGILYYAISFADDISSVAIATLTNVPFATLLAIIFLGERIGLISITGMVLAFSGVMVLGFDPKALEHFFDLSLVMLAAFVYAVGTILLRRLKGIGVFSLQAWIGLVGMVTIFSMSFFLESGQWDALSSSSWLARGGVIFSAVASSIIGHGGLYYLLKHHPVTTVTPLTLLSQVVAVLSGVLILGEVLTLKMIFGGALTFFGVGVILIRKKQKTEAASPAARETRS